MFTGNLSPYGANSGLSRLLAICGRIPELLGHEGGTYGFKNTNMVEPKKRESNFNIDKCNGDGVCSEIMEKLHIQKLMDENDKRKFRSQDVKWRLSSCPLCIEKMLEKYKGKCK